MPGRDRLVGRDAAVRQAEGARDETRAGHGQLVLIAGDAGIGKSAVASAVADEAAARDMRVTWGFCWEPEGAPAFWPWAQALRGLGADVPQVDAADAADRFHLFDAVTTALGRVAGDGALAVFLEDLQWADEPSLLLLEFVARQLPSMRLVVVGTYRDAEAGARLRGFPGASEVITLGGLDAAGVRSVMAAVTGAEPSAADADEVLRRTGGNPLFVRELSRLGVDVAGVPDTVRAVLGRRLARLSPPCADLLATAALLGGEVRPEVLARLAPAGPATDLVAVFDEAVRAGVLAPAADPLAPHRFGHDLFRSALADGLTPSDRAARHLRAGRALAQLHGEGASVYAAQVAAHFAAAAGIGGAADAVTWSARAAAESFEGLAWEDACVHYERALTALELTDRADPGAAADLLLGLGAARDRSGDASGARTAFHDAARLARRLGDPDGLARAALGVHRLGAVTGSGHREQIELLEEAAAALAGAESTLRARVLAAQARELHHSWTAAGVRRAPEVAGEAVEIARRQGDSATLSVCLLALHDARWTRASAHARLEVVDELATVAVAAGDRDRRAQAHLLRAAALLELADPAGRAELHEYCRLAAALGHARARWGALSRQAVRGLPRAL